MATYDDDLNITPAKGVSRQAVFDNRAVLPVNRKPAHQLRNEHEAWVDNLLEDDLKRQLDYVEQAGYVAWHHKGLQLLRLRSGRRGLELWAGVQYSGTDARPRHAPGHLRVTLVGNPTGTGLRDQMREVIDFDMLNGSLTVVPIEHRLQATLSRMHGADALTGAASPLGLARLKREFPAFRAPERPGFIDFLGIDANGELHVVETKVGHDPKVLLQALDYAIWVEANQKAIREHLGACWQGPEDGRVHLDLVLAGKGNACAVNPYLPGQVAALAPDVPWRIFTVEDPRSEPLGLLELHEPELWQPAPGRVARAIAGASPAAVAA